MSEARNILIVDDELEMNRLIRQIFRREIMDGIYKIEFSANPLEVEDILKKEEFDIILSDINMPQMSGLDLLDIITSISPITRTIMITAYGDMDRIRVAMQRGAFDFIQKPFDRDELRFSINRALEYADKLKKERYYIKKIEEYSKELEKKVEERTKEIMEIYRELTIKNEKLENDLKLAREIQANIIPDKLPENDRVEMSAYYMPMEYVGGDFYDAKLINNNIYFIISDVSGHGIAAALITTMIKAMFERVGSDNLDSPDRILKYINNVLFGKILHNFITAFVCKINIEDMYIEFASAGHVSPILISSEDIIYLESEGKPLCVMEDIHIEQKKIPLKKGDKLIFYTDGLIEVTDTNNIELGSERLYDIINKNKSLSAKEVLNIIIGDIVEFKGEHKFDDDIAAVAMQIK